MSPKLRLAPSPRQLKSILLYLIDWIFVGGTALVAFSFSRLTPNVRPFSIEDVSISYPHQHNAKIPTRLLVIISTIIPGILIALVVFGLPSYRSQQLKTRIWLLNTSWLGLGISLAGAMLVTDGMKNLVGKPRPDLLSRCSPDPERLASGNYSIGDRYLFGPGICTSWYRTTTDGLDKSELLDGFRSWVSGHASISFAGLTFLTLFLISHVLKQLGAPGNGVANLKSPRTYHPSAPLLLILSAPLLGAAYVATTRYSDYRHHGVDIILGSLLGIFTAFVGWNWYGSRAVDGKRAFGGFSRIDKQRHGHRSEADPELGYPDEAHSANPSVTGDHTRDESGAQGGSVLTDASREVPGFSGNNANGELKGSLQLREVSLSISTLDTPQDRNTVLPSGTHASAEGIEIITSQVHINNTTKDPENIMSAPENFSPEI
ncbi:phosphatidic acid phosphatase type 2/haloperoxidase [Kalaharituber pfeilii]|nr:phosphatidic acid phosphatase type 2/haloperoxidase [Kalaharituber pfeilii]